MKLTFTDLPSPFAFELAVGGQQLSGDLAIPRLAHGVVLFAHGSGSSRKSPRHQAVARALASLGFATLLLDLLSPEEERRDELGGRFCFDVELLARRLDAAVDELERRMDTRNLPVGLFGASTGAAAALISASRRGSIHAVVSRGGRPDLAGDALEHVCAPTRLIVGGRDEEVLRLNREAYLRLCGKKDLVVIPGASHLFEERGALEQVAELACEWFTQHLGGTWPAC